MSLSEVVVEATLKADGTLELDQKPGLPPGRVTVVLRQKSEPATLEGWWPYMQRARAEREATGYQFLSDAEMEAHVQWLREDEDRLDRIHREMEIEKRRQEGA
jgi:hypothetical protein